MIASKLVLLSLRARCSYLPHPLGGQFQTIFCIKVGPRVATGGNFISKMKYSNHFSRCVVDICISKIYCKWKFCYKTVRVYYTTIPNWPPSRWSVSAESHMHLIHTSLRETILNYWVSSVYSLIQYIIEGKKTDFQYDLIVRHYATELLVVQVIS